jgi:uncharacterized protein (TIGR02246 family)
MIEECIRSAVYANGAVAKPGPAAKLRVVSDFTFCMRAVLVLCLRLPTVALGQQPASHADDDAVRAVRAVAEAIIAADNARDLERVLELYARDAVLLPPNAEPVVGRPAIRPRYEALFRAMNPAIVSEVAEVRVGGDWAFVRGRNTGEMRPIDGSSAPRRLNDLYVMILSRGDDGRWRIARLMWHPGAS